jgi:hypothetical protein
MARSIKQAQTFLFYLFEHYSEEVMTVNENSTCHQPGSRLQSVNYMILILNWNTKVVTKPNSNIVPKAEIISKILSIEIISEIMKSIIAKPLHIQNRQAKLANISKLSCD